MELFDLVLCLSRAMDLVTPEVVSHQMQVAYAACCLGEELGLPLHERRRLVLAAALHDCGILSLRERKDLMEFDVREEGPHAGVGAQLLRTCPQFRHEAEIVRFHHRPWDEGRGAEEAGRPIPLASHIVHLADRVCVLCGGRDILSRVGAIAHAIGEQSGRMFHPDHVAAFRRASDRESFWLDLAMPDLAAILRERIDLGVLETDDETSQQIGRLFARIVDFRSPFTATHTNGVAATASALARHGGFCRREARMMTLAGYLHDLGKLAVPAEIIGKPDRLTPGEFDVIRSHTFYTYRCLEPIAALDTVSTWAAFHHERLDGKGYPFHHAADDLSLGSRIMAVADVFTAVTEDRPYRAGMSVEKALGVLDRMAATSALDGDVVALLKLHAGTIDADRQAAQRAAMNEYAEMFSPAYG